MANYKTKNDIIDNEFKSEAKDAIKFNETSWYWLDEAEEDYWDDFNDAYWYSLNNDVEAKKKVELKQKLDLALNPDRNTFKEVFDLSSYK